MGNQILLSEDGTSAQRATYTQSAWDAGLVFGDAPLPPREVRAKERGKMKYMKLKKTWVPENCVKWYDQRRFQYYQSVGVGVSKTTGFSTNLTEKILHRKPTSIFKGVFKKVETSSREKTNTPWKFNIAPENKPSQKESDLQTIICQGLC